MSPKRKMSTRTSNKKAKRTKSTTTTARPATAAASSTSNTTTNAVCHFYPEMTNARAQAYIDGTRSKPLDDLQKALDETAHLQKTTSPGNVVVHWFRADLRTRDNRALTRAAEAARAAGVPLVCLFIVSPEDWTAHSTAPVRIDLILRTLAVLRADLGRLSVPLWIETVTHQRDVPAAVLARMAAWGSRRLCANMEYEVDELRRDTTLVRLAATQDTPVCIDVVHDTCLVPPGTLATRSGGRAKAYAVFTPWFSAWKQYLGAHEELLDTDDAPAQQKVPEHYAGLFDSPIPQAPVDKRLSAEKSDHFRLLYPAGEAEAMRRLEAFCDERLDAYADERNVPAVDGTSVLSPYLACGAVSARTAVRTACERNGTASLNGGSAGFRSWVRELAFRDFYRHVLAAWPHVCMNKPFRLAATGIPWERDPDGTRFAAWARGHTGVPIVDAAMRQLQRDGWLHNRVRMVTASFLAKDLLLDWRRGERFFLENLVDGDFANNNGGWGFSASVGVDPQPYFRIFSPLRQSQRFDPDGAYIRRWVPELRGLNDAAAVHAPYDNDASAAVARAAGYPEPIVDHAAARQRALTAYKEGLSRNRA